MKFEEALAAMRAGKLLKRKEWTGNNSYTIRSIITDNVGDVASNSFFSGDLMAEDWEIVE